jgi:uncharacterized membrane protein YkgB
VWACQHLAKNCVELSILCQKNKVKLSIPWQKNNLLTFYNLSGKIMQVLNVVRIGGKMSAVAGGIGGLVVAVLLLVKLVKMKDAE